MRRLSLAAYSKPSQHPVIDELTLKMVRALRQATEPETKHATRGFMVCACGASSPVTPVIVPNGWLTHGICVHHVAYHRADVSVRELEAIRTLPAGSDLPSEYERRVPELRLGSDHVTRTNIQSISIESTDPDVMHWTYTIAFYNHDSGALHLSHAEVAVSVAGVYGDPERVEIQEAIPGGDTRSVRHVTLFRLAELRRGRSEAIAALLSLSSRVAANWEVYGEWEDGTPASLRVEAVVSETE
jgi:hypothetical protein